MKSAGVCKRRVLPSSLFPQHSCAGEKGEGNVKKRTAPAGMAGGASDGLLAIYTRREQEEGFWLPGHPRTAPSRHDGQLQTTLCCTAGAADTVCKRTDVSGLLQSLLPVTAAGPQRICTVFPSLEMLPTGTAATSRVSAPLPSLFPTVPTLIYCISAKVSNKSSALRRGGGGEWGGKGCSFLSVAGDHLLQQMWRACRQAPFYLCNIGL